MNVLIVAAYYPYADYPSWGVSIERCACALRECCEKVEVLAPRPYVPPLASTLALRWKSYGYIRRYEVRKDIPIHRPAYLQVPRMGGVIWADPGAFLCCRQAVREMHCRSRFDVIISFDLLAAGGMAWRIGKDLGIPACGWANGNDVRVPASSSYERSLLRTIERLDLVFYQSRELLETAAERLGISPAQMPPNRHMVLTHGIPFPPSIPRVELRKRIRAEWKVNADDIVVLNIGRIVRNKGIFELLDAISLSAKVDPRIVCVLIGSKPSFDETTIVRNKLCKTPNLTERVRLLPNCSPDEVWEYLCAADIFAFSSLKEGMPNSLLEAMAMGVPAIGFAIPPLLEIEGGTGCIVMVPPFNCTLFSEAILRLAASPEEGASMAAKAMARVTQNFMIRDKMVEVLRRVSQIAQQRVA